MIQIQLNKKIIFAIILVFVVFSSIFIYDVFWVKEEKIAYINNQQLFDSFTFKKELEKEYLIIEKAKLKELDSLKAQLQSMVINFKNQSKLSLNQNEVEKYKSLQEYVIHKEEEVSSQAEAIVRDYDMKIWEQLNQYVADFAKERDYDMLLGSKGDGNIMYAKEYFDATEQAIAYVNNRYLGKK